MDLEINHPYQFRVPRYCDLAESFEIIEGSCIPSDYNKITTLENDIPLYSDNYISPEYKYNLLYRRTPLPLIILCFSDIVIEFDMAAGKKAPTKIRIHGWFLNEELRQRLVECSSKHISIPASPDSGYSNFVIFNGMFYLIER
jgi:hypothetical protein